MVAEVIVNIGGHDVLDYEVPEEFPGSLPGRRVIVEIGKKQVLGLVRAIKNESNFAKLKPILSLIDSQPVISEELLSLHKEAAEYYLTPLGRITELSFPSQVKSKSKKEIRLHLTESKRLLLSAQEQELLLMIEEKQINYHQIINNKTYQPMLMHLLKQKLVSIAEVFEETSSSCKELLIFNKEPQKPFQSESRPDRLYRYMKQMQKVYLEDIKKHDAYHSSVLATLLNKEVLIRKKISLSEHLQLQSKNWNKKTITLTTEQQEVLEQIRLESKPTLLFGVTGSGKTEIYIELMRDCLKSGKSVLYMVPEISLIAQSERRIQEKIDQEILHWHSLMPDKEKGETWEKLQTDLPHIVLGARSAVFAPIKNPGLIIIDEEHETSYKQNEPDPRYHAVHLALIRASISGARIVMGSATPSLQSYHKAISGEFAIGILENRPVEAKLPRVHVIDLKEEFLYGNRSVFSRLLQQQITETLDRDEQVILFLNRRGFSRFYLCRECGYVISCSRCSVPMVMHRKPDLLKCHYCDHNQQLPVSCPSCQSRFIKDMGTGTQKIETLLEETFKKARVTRLDQDQIKDRYSYEELLSDFSSGKTNILLGTQMVVKGLDFSGVTLVGIISADLSLHIPDLYAAERTFQLLTQVAGRAGRGQREGQVVIQTYNPDHFAITSAKNHDYPSFYNEEIKQRKMMNYPPFCKLIRFLVTGENREETLIYTENLYKEVAGILENQEILGPGEAPINKIKNRYRFHFIVKTNDNFLHNYLKENYNKIKHEGQKQNIRVLIDVEPYLIL